VFPPSDQVVSHNREPHSHRRSVIRRVARSAAALRA
jgi:hypothetical protein